MSDPVRAKLLTRIGTSDDVVTLRGLRDQIHERMEALHMKQPIEQFNTDLNEVHDALIRRAISLSEAQMARLGHGSPPVPYAYLLFGSGGRAEQTLSSDQDSGMIYDDPEEESKRERVTAYFHIFAETIVDMLQKLGYPPCEGEVISSNPNWCQSLSQWKAKLDGWFEDPDWENVRYLLIIADSRIIYGQNRLLQAMKDHYYSDMLNHRVIVHHMLNNTMRHKVLIGVFGQLLKEQYGTDAGSLDLKYGAYIPMVNAMRLLSIQAGVRETSTLARINRLRQLAVLTEEECVLYSGIFRLFMRLRLMSTEKREDGLYTNNGKLPQVKLTKALIDELKSGLKGVKKLQRFVHKQTTGRL
ncbi:DUF294 nucleotidyltransferase-like domain-containing protein [Paenibacillus sp. CF384]|uniref:DUF294 nucleotidyltransferase-like domain-containing protein n=1 Tax=Paenibacillus sp. CF384 TaxID=1884382 RepID=UPI00089497E2|nr:DUF294 nucleotidyltransferase-like domain-containing protein [Paenibacillus sp. CF384]SDW53610.1 CBS domain-containing protein [Paenibacillus sp. CF384]